MGSGISRRRARRAFRRGVVPPHHWFPPAISNAHGLLRCVVSSPQSCHALGNKLLSLLLCYEQTALRLQRALRNMTKARRLKCSFCGQPVTSSTGIECLGVIVCDPCHTRHGDPLMCSLLWERGLLDEDGKPTEKARALDARIYDDEGHLRPQGRYDA